MNATLLKSRPLSGEYEEVYFNLNEELACIKFEDENYLEYCGIFGGGLGSCSALAVLNQTAFIVSFGQGYIFDINNRIVVHKTKCDQLIRADRCQLKKYFVACSQIQLYVYDNTGLVWSSDRISSDGIEIDEIKNETVYGRVYDFEKWVDFHLNLNTFEYYCDWVCEIR